MNGPGIGSDGLGMFNSCEILNIRDQWDEPGTTGTGGPWIHDLYNHK